MSEKNSCAPSGDQPGAPALRASGCHLDDLGAVGSHRVDGRAAVAVAEERDAVLDRRPAGPKIEVRPTGQLLLIGTIRIHHPQVAAAPERDPLAVGRPRRDTRPHTVERELRLARAIGVHDPDLVHAFDTSGPCDARPVRGPHGEHVVGAVIGQRLRVGPVGIHDPDVAMPMWVALEHDPARAALGGRGVGCTRQEERNRCADDQREQPRSPVPAISHRWAARRRAARRVGVRLDGPRDRSRRRRRSSRSWGRCRSRRPPERVRRSWLTGRLPGRRCRRHERSPAAVGGMAWGRSVVARGVAVPPAASAGRPVSRGCRRVTMLRWGAGSSWRPPGGRRWRRCRLQVSGSSARSGCRGS